MARLPVTTAHLRVHHQSFRDQCLQGEVQAGDSTGNFSGSLIVVNSALNLHSAEP